MLLRRVSDIFQHLPQRSAARGNPPTLFARSPSSSGLVGSGPLVSTKRRKYACCLAGWHTGRRLRSRETRLDPDRAWHLRPDSQTQPGGLQAQGSAVHGY